MLEIVKSGGWLMLPIIICSIISAAIILERLWTLQPGRVLPRNLTRQVWEWVSKNQLNHTHIESLHNGSPLGEILAAGLANRHREREVIKESIEDAGRQVVHDLERFLNSLGTIAAITPLLGLLGTVIGMVKVFAAITTHGVGDPTVLAGGISEALITTAAGLTVAIPSLIGYRYLRGRVDALVVRMEKEAVTMVEALMRKQYMDTLGERDEVAARHAR
ncbi:MAG: MotA/TolQ/ExbB proton channel family protein [Gammaproteobacteria bacterium]